MSPTLNYIVWILIFQVSAMICSAQNNYTNWYFGDGCLISFKGETLQPSKVKSCVSVDGVGTRYIEGSSSIDDDSGDLLFHGHGGKIYYRNQLLAYQHQEWAHASSLQSVILVKARNSLNQYICVQSPSWEQVGLDSNACANYIVFDVKGDVVLERAINLRNMENFALTLSSDSIGYWLASVERLSKGRITLKAFYFDSTASIVDSSITYVSGYLNGTTYPHYNKLSPDGRYFVGNRVISNGMKGVLITKFSNENGKFYDPIIIETQDRSMPYKNSAEFSPNSNYLYLIKVHSENTLLVQYDLSSWDAKKILASETVIDTINTDNDQDMIGGMQIGPDGKIYVFHRASSYLSRINNPNDPGIACNYKKNEIRLNNSYNVQGAPYYPSYSFCVEDTISLQSSYHLAEDSVLSLKIDSARFSDIVWSTGDTGPILQIDSSGFFTVNATNRWGIEQRFRFHVEMTDKDEISLYVPTAFTPNRDNINDYFGPSALHLKSYRMEVYNRWGALLYSSEDLNARWDGRVNDTDCEEGVYMYIIWTMGNNGKLVFQKGTFTLIR